jgi:HIRAN domain
MTTKTFNAPIVGMHFRPPANRVLQQLPFGTLLILRRQPDNEYDAAAIQVLLEGFSSAGPHAELYKSCLLEAIPDEQPAGRGCWNACQLTDPLHLGYVASKNGPAAEISSLLDAAGLSTIGAFLGATETGQPCTLFKIWGEGTA